MPVKIAICDDESVHLDILQGCVAGCPVWRKDEQCINKFTRAEELLDAVRAGEAYSYIFIDIDMPGLSGLDVYTELAQTDAAVIFVSAHLELLPEVFKLRPFAYGFVAKPYTQETFTRAVQSVLLQRANTQLFTYFAKGRENAVPCREIFYFITKGHYLYLHAVDGEEVLYRITLDEVEQQLAGCGFFRINRSCLVNLYHCVGRKGDAVTVAPLLGRHADTAFETFALARRRAKEFDKQYLTYKMRKERL